TDHHHRLTRSDLPGSSPESLGASMLIGGATLQLIEPPFADDGARFDWMAAHTTTHAVDVVIGLLAIPLLMRSTLLLGNVPGGCRGWPGRALRSAGAEQQTFDVIKPPPGLRTYPLVFDNVEVRRRTSVQQSALADVRPGELFSPRS
ncbi:MAG TPA: hypothetical protein VNT24_08705, partial [Propionibacteriaceae bacterium]|nr:hypothetical protein [Propionibacteriaceae bacterium]